ncbi:hypothetical protein DL768_009553 [Monosporascus sp. mg162]|nr:hypothetical protein DL768_009553 [Monosporascus sp. mg162]
MASGDSWHHSTSSPEPQPPSRSPSPKEKSRLGRPAKEMTRQRIEAEKKRNPTRGIQRTVHATPSRQHGDDAHAKARACVRAHHKRQTSSALRRRRQPLRPLQPGGAWGRTSVHPTRLPWTSLERLGDSDPTTPVDKELAKFAAQVDAQLKVGSATPTKVMYISGGVEKDMVEAVLGTLKHMRTGLEGEAEDRHPNMGTSWAAYEGEINRRRSIVALLDELLDIFQEMERQRTN